MGGPGVWNPAGRCPSSLRKCGGPSHLPMLGKQPDGLWGCPSRGREGLLCLGWGRDQMADVSNGGVQGSSELFPSGVLHPEALGTKGEA